MMKRYSIADVEREIAKLNACGKGKQAEAIKHYIQYLGNVDKEFYQIKEDKDPECEEYVKSYISYQRCKQAIEKKFETTVYTIDAYNSLVMWEFLSKRHPQKNRKGFFVRMDNYTRNLILKDLRKHLRPENTLAAEEVEGYLEILTKKAVYDKQIEKISEKVHPDLLVYADENEAKMESQEKNYLVLKFFIEQQILKLALEESEKQKWCQIAKDVSFNWDEDEMSKLKQKVLHI